MITITDFIKELDKFLAGDVKTVPENPDDELSWEFITNAGEIEQLACDLFIEEGGGCDWDAIDSLEEESGGLYRIGPGETDGFGWLTGCIHTPKGIIVYG